MFSPHPVRQVQGARSFALPVDAEFKALKIQLRSFSRPHMRAFHFAWFSFFLCFVGWFSLAPMMPIVRVSMGLCANGGWEVINDPRECRCGTECQSALATANMVSVSGTIIMRLVVGSWAETYGPRFSQTFIMTVFAIPLALCGLATDITGLAIARFFIGMIGASFVLTQYWTAVMFASPIIGAATATTAGWGNLGGGFAQVFMPWVYSWFSNLGPDIAWRVAVVIPSVLLFAFGVIMYCSSDDVPEGRFKELYAAGVREKPNPVKLFKIAATDVRVWLLFAIYGGCFGTELTMNNMLVSYFYDYFGLDLQTAGLAASLFGLMNIFARSMGGILSDVTGKLYGFRGRHWTLFGAQLSEGLMLLAFSRVESSQFTLALICLVFFSTFVQMAEGAEFAIVPAIGRYKNALGPVGGIVGAGGNVGAILFSLIYRSYADSDDPREPFLIHGLCVLGTAALIPFVHYNNFGSMFIPPAEDRVLPDSASESVLTLTTTPSKDVVSRKSVGQ